jgi:hypothetical protein
MHPEYHALINNVELDYFPEQGEVNPFLHINLHLSLKEQKQKQSIAKLNKQIINLT